MDTAMVVDLGRQALWMTMLLSGPLLLVALVVGLIIGIFQAATSINEQTLTFIPKGCAISGWAKAAPRQNSFTAIYFEPELLHEEHDTICVPPGAYRIVRQREFDVMEGVRRVAD